MKTIEEYLALPYTMIVRWSADDELFVARVKEIEGCTGHGDTEADALVMLRDNLREWIAFCLESDDPIPIPTDPHDLPSGKWVQRVPRSIHAQLVSLAATDGVSLNQLVVSILSREVGCRSHVGMGYISNIGASADPSTNHWNLVHEEIAVNQSWKILDCVKPNLIHDVFLARLVKALPQKSKVDDLHVGNYGEKTDHNNWN
jgi:antitoxin HicB